MDENQIARFWEKVDKNGAPPTHLPELGACWIWGGRTNKIGYGRWSYFDPIGDVAEVFAHRTAWFLAHGKIPEGIKALHKCDNPRCVNPRHLFLGTQLANIADMNEKGRRRGLSHAAGSSNNAAKLTADDVRVIRSRRAAGDRLHTIAFDYGVTRQNIARIIKGQTWKTA